MQINILCVGKTDNKHLEVLLKDYLNRLKKYTKSDFEYILAPKSFGKLPPDVLKRKEGELILAKVNSTDLVVLLDERGKSFTSAQFANQIQKFLNCGFRKVHFVIGGALGFDQAVYQRANHQLSLSAMTTTHQLIRLFLIEQVYRAFTILEGHPYHNE